MRSFLQSRRQDSSVRISFNQMTLFQASASMLCFCVLAFAPHASSSSGNRQDTYSGCFDVETHYQCSQLGELLGRKMIKGSVAKCTSEKLSELSIFKARKMNLVLYQFSISHPSSVTIKGKGLKNLAVHEGSSVAHPVVAQGTDFKLYLTTGNYTLVGEAHDCLGDRVDEYDRYRIAIKAQKSSVDSESAEPVSEPSERGGKPAVERTFVWLSITIGVLLALALMGVILAQAYPS